MPYVDGYILPVSVDNIKAYTKMAKLAAKVWMDHGALEYRECVSDDMEASFGVPFPKNQKTKPGETVIFAWIVFKSKAHRDQVNKKAMNDPRLSGMGGEPMPFDCKRMVYGGFKVIVDSKAD